LVPAIEVITINRVNDYVSGTVWMPFFKIDQDFKTCALGEGMRAMFGKTKNTEIWEDG